MIAVCWDCIPAYGAFHSGKWSVIKFLIDKSGALRLEQRTLAPAVYLDHWALRSISESSVLSSRFIAALASTGGTLMLSWLNLAEFTKVTDQAQVRRAEDLVETMLPNVFFLEVNPFAVMDAEDKLLLGGPPNAPHADMEFCRAFAFLKPSSVKPFTAVDLFLAAHESARGGRLDLLADTLAKRVNALRQTLDNDPELTKLVRRLPSGPEMQRGTRFVLKELVRTFLIDRGIAVTRNHAIDLLHSVVPTAYSDFVLLDGHWQVQVDRVRSRFAEAGMSIPLARVYSEKKKGLDQFFSEIEALATTTCNVMT